jgi:hypothetical protein
MADIFISYARGDRERIRPLAVAFSERGWSVFWDLEIPPGQSWRSYLKGRLDEARCVVVAWSETSVESHWVQVEADEGLRRGVLVPVCIDQTEPPFGFGHVQAADLSGWQGSPTSAVFVQTVRAVETILGPSQAGEKPEGEPSAGQASGDGGQERPMLPAAHRAPWWRGLRQNLAVVLGIVVGGAFALVIVLTALEQNRPKAEKIAKVLAEASALMSQARGEDTHFDLMTVHEKLQALHKRVERFEPDEFQKDTLDERFAGWHL